MYYFYKISYMYRYFVLLLSDTKEFNSDSE